MSGLQRIDFDAVGLFFDALGKIHHAGKKIVLVDVNELIYPLLEAFSATRYAVMLRRKA
jgi:ABC-type transporter Mla MlaB component